jgi:hypothetical protein
MSSQQPTLDAVRLVIFAVEQQLLALNREAKGRRRKRLEDALIKAHVARAALNGMR